MWFGLLHLTPDSGDAVDAPQAVVVAYQTDRLLRIGAAVDQIPEVVRLLHLASDGGRSVRPPRCGACDAPWDVPPLDEEESACASA